MCKFIWGILISLYNMSCKIMTIPVHTRGKTCTSMVLKSLDKHSGRHSIPSPEPMGLSVDTRFNNLLIFCDPYSQTFRLCGIWDKSTNVCIDSIELIISNISICQKNSQTIQHVLGNAGSEFWSVTFRKLCSENKIQFTSAAPKTSRTKLSSWATLGHNSQTFKYSTSIHAQLNRIFSIMQLNMHNAFTI